MLEGGGWGLAWTRSGTSGPVKLRAGCCRRRMGGRVTRGVDHELLSALSQTSSADETGRCI